MITITKTEASSLLILISIAVANIGAQLAQMGSHGNDDGRAIELLAFARAVSAKLAAGEGANDGKNSS